MTKKYIVEIPDLEGRSIEELKILAGAFLDLSNKCKSLVTEKLNILKTNETKKD